MMTKVTIDYECNMCWVDGQKYNFDSIHIDEKFIEVLGTQYNSNWRNWRLQIPTKYCIIEELT